MRGLESFKGKFFFKLLLVGELAVGKTSNVLRYVEDRFVTNLQPIIGTNFLVKKIEKGAFHAILQIWDIGDYVRRVQDVSRIYYQGVDGVVFVYDLTRKDTNEPLIDNKLLNENNIVLFIFTRQNSQDLVNYSFFIAS